MLYTLAVANYRSLRELVLPLGSLSVIAGANASGKSNLYRSLRLLSETAQGGASASIAREGGLESVLWAGPETFTRAVRSGEHPVQGGPRKGPVSLRLGFAAEEFSYAIEFGLPPPSQSAFTHDPEIKRESIWHGPKWRPSAALVDRKGPVVTTLGERRERDVIAQHVSTHASMFTEVTDPVRAPEILMLRDMIRSWRFYDHFRTDAQAPARLPQVGTRTTVLSHDGHDLAAALQTIREIGDGQALDDAVDDAFPGASVVVTCDAARFGLRFQQEGLLRGLSQSELSDGTLRYLLWVAALLTPRPPALMVLNEPETSLHPDLVPALARLMIKASEATQIWVVSHSTRLIAALEESRSCVSLNLEKTLGETTLLGQDPLEQPMWAWPPR